jgi:uncharacterized protein YndB with AHSA1/START domain
MSEEKTELRDDGFTITRVFDAPRELVWQAFTEPEHFGFWFGGPNIPVDPETVSMDVRPGGEWKATMILEGGRLHPFVGTYREVVPPERLVFTYENPDDRSDPHVEIATVIFNDLGDKTEVVYDQTGQHPPDEYQYTMRGTSEFFDALDERLAQVQAAS